MVLPIHIEHKRETRHADNGNEYSVYVMTCRTCGHVIESVDFAVSAYRTLRHPRAHAAEYESVSLRVVVEIEEHAA